MKRAYAAAVMVASGLLAPAVMPAAQAQATPNDTAQDNQKNSGSTAHRVPPFDPGYWTPDRMRNAKTCTDAHRYKRCIEAGGSYQNQ